MHIVQSVVVALGFAGQELVIDAQEVGRCGLEAVQVERTVGDVAGEVFGLAVDVAGPDTCAVVRQEKKFRRMLPAPLIFIRHSERR